MKRIYIFSGLLSSILPGFRKGTNEIKSKLKKEHPQDQVTTMVWNKWGSAADMIYKQYAKEGYKDKVILIGHSNGVKACSLVAHYLDVMNIEVDYVGAIDPTASPFPAFPDSTKKVDEFFASSGYPAFIRRVTQNKLGVCTFSEDYKGEHNTFDYHSGHVDLASSSKVHKQIIKSIKKLE